MIDYQDEYLRYRIERARETLRVAKLLVAAKEFNSCVNRLYYAAFYAVNALLLKHGYASSKHVGVRSFFNQHFVRTGIVPDEYGVMFNFLFEYRRESDYRDLFYADPAKIEPLLSQVEKFIEFVSGLIKQPC